MIRNLAVSLFVCAGFLLGPNRGAFAQAQQIIPKPLPFVSPLFGDDMVLQRGKANTLWGWTEPGNAVTVQIGATIASAFAGSDSRWQIQIQPPAVGGPYTVKITGP